MRSILLLLSTLLLAGAALAQSDRGAITGTVADPAGALVPGATISAKHIETGAEHQTESTATGNYTLSQLPVGVYQLSVSLPGFKQYVRQGITVLVAQTLRIDVTLEVGAITESVTVTADAALLKTESGELSHNVASKKISELPMVGWAATIRDPYTVTQLIPGASYRDRSTVRINGAPNMSQSLRVEGQDATHSMMPDSTAQSAPSVEAIEEFAVQTSNYAAEYGQAGGGVFNVTMKSGSNQFHGGAYDYWANEALNAGTPFLAGNPRPRVRRNNYGFTLGGPVVIPKVFDGHNRLFFFFSFEQFREKGIINNQIFTLPTLAYREGDFRQALTGRVLGKDPLGRDIIEGTIYDPRTEREAPNGQRVRDPFPNNTIPKELFDPVALKIQSLIPNPTNSDLINNYQVPWENPNIRNIPALKVDYNVSSRSKISFYWSTTDQHAIHSLGPSGGDGIDSPISSHRPTNVESYTTRINFEHALRPTLLLHLGGGLQGTNFNDIVKFNDFDQLKELGLPGAQSTIPPYLTGLCLAAVCSGKGGMKNIGPNTQSESIMFKPTANASLTWVKNSHTYKFGAELRIEGFPTDLLAGTYGTYAFSPIETGLPSTQGQNLQGGTVGFPYASFLLGRVNNGNIAVASNPRLGKQAWAFFAQDSWKVTRKLTLDYGLRWDYQTYFQEQYGRLANFSPTTPNPTAGGLPGAVIFEGAGPGRCNCDFAKVYPYAFGPRLGVAYQITPKTVFRAGWGITYSQTAFENRTSQNAGSQNPFSASSYGDPAILLREGPPAPKGWPNLDAGQFPRPGQINSPPIAIDHNAGRPPRMIQWSIGIQRELTRNLALEVSYVGNRGAWWEANSLIDVNALTPERLAAVGLDINSPDDQRLLTSQLNSTLAVQRGFNKPPYAGFPLAQTVAQSLRPFPQFGTIDYRWAPLGRTWYDSLQAKVTKRFSHGLDFTNTFSWQKELTMGAESIAGGSGITPSVNDVFNRPLNKYISGMSRPFVFVTAVNYTLPKWSSSRLLSVALGDWTLGAILQYQSGMPIKVPVAQNQLSSHLFRSTFANRVPGEPLWTADINCNGCFDPYTDFVLNPKAWVDPPAGQFGNSPAYYNDYREMRRPSEAMSLGRVFRLKESVSFSVRADFRNIFNRTVIANPTSANAKATQQRNAAGMTTAGFGDINTASQNTGFSQRIGMIVARIMF
jgi:hypothetical protein